jgi:hypothetical protein
MARTTSTYLSAAKRANLIDQYMECWYDTESYNTEDKVDKEEGEMRAYFSALPNPQLYKETKETGWSII